MYRTQYFINRIYLPINTIYLHLRPKGYNFCPLEGTHARWPSIEGGSSENGLQSTAALHKQESTRRTDGVRRPRVSSSFVIPQYTCDAPNVRTTMHGLAEEMPRNPFIDQWGLLYIWQGSCGACR